MLPVALEPVSRGDAAWWAGDREAAVATWKAGLATVGDAGAEDAGEDAPEALAAQAMMRIRLLQLSGNLGPLRHGAPLDAALAACPPAAPACALARADYALFMPPIAGGDPTRAAAFLTPSVRAALPGPADARLVVAGAGLSLLDPYADDALDGMGRGIRATGRRRPEAPGTWVLQAGVGGAPGLGVGVALRYSDPDLSWDGHLLDAALSVSTLGDFSVRGALRLDAPAAPRAFGGVSRSTVPDYDAGGEIPGSMTFDALILDTVSLGGGIGGSVGPVGVAGGLLGRIERTEGQVPGLAEVGGPWVDTRLRRGTSQLQAGGSLLLGTYADLALRSALSGAVTVLEETPLSLTLLGRIGGEVSPLGSTPWYHLPAAGGTDLLRGLPSGWYRDTTLGFAQAEVHRLIREPFEAALFVDGALVEGPHLTAGGGLRMVLPPDRRNVTRLDVGFGEGAWGIVVSWGDVW